MKPTHITEAPCGHEVIAHDQTALRISLDHHQKRCAKCRRERSRKE